MRGNAPRVVFINHWAKKLGGAEYSLLDILSFISVCVHSRLVTSEAGQLTTKAVDLNVECQCIPCSLQSGNDVRRHMLRTLVFLWKETASFFRFVLSVSRFVKSVKPQCIHANVPLSHAALFLIVVLGYRGKCCFHMREIFKRNSLPYLFYRFLFPYQYGHIIAISESVKQHLPSPLRKKAVVIYNGVDVPQLPPEKTIAAGSPMRFLYLGRIVPWKGCHDLIDIFAHARNRRRMDCALSLIGDTDYWSGAYRMELNERIRLHDCEANCRLLPHTDDPRAAMRSHDVFVNASFQEPFGRSIAEAQAEGLPVVAYDSGGVAEIVEHEVTGLLVPYGNEDAFVQAIERLMDNREEAVAMGKQGHERVKRLFNRAIQIPKICDEIVRGI